MWHYSVGGVSLERILDLAALTIRGGLLARASRLPRCEELPVEREELGEQRGVLEPDQSRGRGSTIAQRRR